MTLLLLFLLMIGLLQVTECAGDIVGGNGDNCHHHQLNSLLCAFIRYSFIRPAAVAAAAMALPVLGDQLDKCALSAVVVPSPAAPTPLSREGLHRRPLSWLLLLLPPFPSCFIDLPPSTVAGELFSLSLIELK